MMNLLHEKCWSYPFLCLRLLKILLPYCHVTLGFRSVFSYLIRYASKHLGHFHQKPFLIFRWMHQTQWMREFLSSQWNKRMGHLWYTLWFLLEFIRKSMQVFFQYVSDKTQWNSQERINNNTDTTLNQTFS